MPDLVEFSLREDVREHEVGLDCLFEFVRVFFELVFVRGEPFFKESVEEWLGECFEEWIRRVFSPPDLLVVDDEVCVDGDFYFTFVCFEFFAVVHGFYLLYAEGVRIDV